MRLKAAHTRIICRSTRNNAPSRRSRLRTRTVAQQTAGNENLSMHTQECRYNPSEPHMHRHAATREHAQCPFIDRDDPRCGSRFRLTRLDQAFSVCFGSFRGCPMYHRLHTTGSVDSLDAEVGRMPVPRRAAALVPVIVTRHGQPIELRPTGT